ncbi:alpha-2-macroglobulin [Psychroserpens sp. SPM9]|uniref:alpha-2-macroglobulin family protein n=1 Tax=Psychroserpens sp. SPM9 TaxID=2975598 RepID=UPI0021A80D07|nr:alpha-2-macroglobulin family protein [Psychroserpens sp. SPM9]MDG5492500.1 alpha-2-macroglobulin family protein [Psychroserpens sp. SPM9]
MKPIISVLMIILFANFTTAQTPEDFSELWKKVSDFESEGLPKSALEIVKSIEKKAKASNNTPQEIKTLLYRSKYALTLEEDAQLSILNEFKAAISKSETPTKNVLQNILATLYWQYFNQNRWKFYNRTKTAEKVDKTDFRTWDLETLFETIQTHYQASLENGLLLQQTSLDTYDALLIEQTNSKIYRPTLFDLLAHNALQFYKTDENTITKPAYKFEIDTPKLLNSAANFATMRLTSKDSTSLQLQALKLYQDLIKFHLKDTSPEALVDVDIERLKFVNQNAIFDNKEELLVKALKAESMQYKAAKEAVSGLYDFEIAQIYQNQGQGYQPKTNETNRWKSKEALAICDAVIADYPKHKAAEKCRILKEQILAQTLQIVVESNNSIQTNGLLLISYKNVAEINFKIAKVNNYQISTLRAYRENRSEELKMLENLKAIHHWTSTLKNEGDYQKHSTEIALPKLDNGRYVIYGSVNNESNTYVFKEFQVTNIAYIQKENNEHITYQIINRLTGQPITNAQVKFSYIKNYQGDYKSETYKTDAYGEFTISRVKYNRTQVKLEITANNETAYFENINVNRYYNYNSDSDTKTRYSGFLFSDRSIYRPGQTLYFKGIILKKKAHKTEIVTNETVEAKLYNTNNEEVAKLELKTNDYGSVSGEFILPDSGLTGNHYLRITGSNNLNIYHGVSVEEYKRPKFEAEFNPVTKTYKVHDTLTVKGEAIAYAGSAITDAKVVYRVHRKVQYPGWYYWRRPYFNSEPQEITHGETLTDASGHFEINFKAIPDESVDKSTLPTFSYEVTADITDINGETRSATTIVNVGYHALTASIGVANRIDKTAKNHQISIDTRNLNGEFVPAKGTIKIYKLIAPNEVLRPRPWNAPDYQEFSKTEFKSLFPHEAYDNEHDSRNWDQGELVFSETFDTEQSKTLDLGKLKRWASGSYRILLETKDRFGQTVKDEAQTHLYSDADTTLADNTLFSITTSALEYKTNETAQVTLGTSAKDLFVTLAIEKDHNIVSKQIINLSNSKKTIQIPVTESDLGGFVVHYTYAFQNSFSSGRLAISVPYPKTDLEIETMTFRDKLQPGTDETWRFKIKGPKGEQVAAELLASMYDASLDQFKSHSWNFHPIQLPIYYSNYRLNSGQSFKTQNLTIRNLTYGRTPYAVQGYDQLNFFGLNFGYGGRYKNYMFNRSTRSEAFLVENDSVEKKLSTAPGVANESEISFGYDQLGSDLDENFRDGDTPSQQENKENEDFGAVKIRKNLQETAFFFPQLQTDSEGYVSFNFTTPEALTKWKLQLLAHTKTLESATTTLETVTQKELMVIPNAPRFLREGDQITISTKIANLTEKKLSGQAKLILTDAISGDDITEHLGILPTGETALFSVDPKGNTQASWTLTIPFDVNAVQYKILAKAGDFSDGEQNALPVLSNRMLVTETLPMWIRSNESKTFTLDKLKNVSSSTLKHHQLTLEMTSNPAWYAVQALPYLMEYPYDCNEQTFSRYYANALASHIATSNPRIQEVFNQWKTTDALLSNLEKNQELKSILIQETPWLRDAQSETEQKKRIALLFDLNKMNNELQSAKRKLKNGQMANGAWPWFNGGRPNRYITQHIITGFGHLDKLNVIESDSEESMIKKAIAYLDAEFIEEYNNIKKYNPDADLSKDHLSYTQLHYLYMRSFFPQIKASKEVEEITKYYHTQIQKYWLSRSLYAKGLMTLVVDRMDDKTTSAKILKSLRETSITSEELGMYWKENTNSWYWYQAPIETHALMIEVFTEAGDVIQSEAKNLEDIDNLKIWLLKNKQTNRWSTTKATTDAVYALLLQGSDWLSVTEMVAVVLGGKNIDPSTLEDVKVEAGTGYYKTSWSSAEIKPEMATVKLTKKGDGIAWGALYWQYFEDLDKITSAETPLSLKKKLFKKVYTAKGEEMTEITSDTNLKVGDLVRVRIELRSDRAMEFVHMKDMRAAGLEPINVLSQYKWQDGLGYYESTKDASTNFFFDYLPKGIYVFEYDLRVNNAGHMSNGITTIQSMYAPEFSSHSEGVKVSVEN